MTDTIIDQTNDPGYATLRVLIEQYPDLREMAKTAEIADDEFTKLASDAFAWPSQRRFPIHSKEHTALSLAYRKAAHAVPLEVDTMLQKAAMIYEIDASFLDKKIEKTAAQEYWLLPEKKRFRISSVDDVKTAERVLHEKYAQLSIEDRAQAYHRLGKIADQHNVTLSPSTYKLAGFTVTSTKILKDWLEARKEACLDKGLSQAYAKLASMYTNVHSHIYDRGSQVKLASAINELDQAAGLEGHYGKTLPDPIQTVFNTEKVSANQVPIGTDFAINKSTLAQLPPTFWEDVLGPDIAKEISADGSVDVEALAQILPTLPADLIPIVQKELAGYTQ